MQRGLGEGRGVDASVPITKETPDSFSYRNLEGQRSNFDVNFCNGQAKCLELESYVRASQIKSLVNESVAFPLCM
jgi:hypothetical protein